MNRGQKAALGLRIGSGFIGWVRKIIANRKAVHAGKPKPYPIGGLIEDAVDMTSEVAEDTSRERPSAKRGGP